MTVPDGPSPVERELLERLARLQRSVDAIELAVEAQLGRGLARRLLAVRLGRLTQYAGRPLVVPDRYRRRPPGTAWPVVSVVTPTLNSAAFLEATVRSVLEQEYPALEYVVQDGGSTDGTLEIVKRYEERLASVESVPDRGQADAINRGFARTTGAIMAYLNGDDLFLPGALGYVACFFARHPDVDVVYGHRVVIDEAGWDVGRWVLPPHDDVVLSWADYVPQETLFWRRRIWAKAGGRLDESFQFAMDWDLLLRFRDAGARLVRLPRFLGAFRVHPAQKTSARMVELGMEEMARLRRRLHGRPVSPAEIRRRVRGYLVRHVVCQRLYRLGVLRY